MVASNISLYMGKEMGVICVIHKNNGSSIDSIIWLELEVYFVVNNCTTQSKPTLYIIKVSQILSISNKIKRSFILSSMVVSNGKKPNLWIGKSKIRIN